MTSDVVKVKSADDWLEKYYPMDASLVSVEDSGKFSLNKWEGMRPEVLKEYGMYVGAAGNLFERSSESIVLHISRHTCPWCHIAEKRYIDNVRTKARCGRCQFCPAIEVGMDSCDTSVENLEMFSIYQWWIRRCDPIPMIDWMEEANRRIEVNRGIEGV